MNHLISVASFFWVAINLLIGFLILLPISIISWLIPVPSVSRICSIAIKHIYRFAVRMDSFWMRRVVGIELVILGEPNSNPAPVVIANHQSWFDIPILQEVISGNGPIITFLIKREIAWVPIIGWICLALNFPRLYRSKREGARESDLSIIQKTTQGHGDDLGALLVFPEGTRFTEAKKTAQRVPYQKLLKPKSGGLRIIQQHVDKDTPLVDITINYHQRGVRIWNCLHGNPNKITVTLHHFKLADIDDIETWLNERWLEKDKILADI